MAAPPEWDSAVIRTRWPVIRTDSPVTRAPGSARSPGKPSAVNSDASAAPGRIARRPNVSPATPRSRPSGVTSSSAAPCSGTGGCAGRAGAAAVVFSEAAACVGERDCPSVSATPECTSIQTIRAETTRPEKANGSDRAPAQLAGGGNQPSCPPISTRNRARVANAPASAAIRRAPDSSPASGAAISSMVKGEAPPPLSVSPARPTSVQAITSSPRQGESPAGTAHPANPGMLAVTMIASAGHRGAPAIRPASPLPPHNASQATWTNCNRFCDIRGSKR